VDGLGGMPLSAAEEAFNADQQDVEIEGLGQVVVGTGFKAFENILRAGTRGQHQDRSVALGVAQGASDGEAVFPRQHAVENDGGDGLGGREEVGKSGVAVGLVMSAIAFGGKVEEQALGQMLFVFD